MQSVFGKSKKIDYSFLFNQNLNIKKEKIEDAISQLKKLDSMLESDIKNDSLYYEQAKIFYSINDLYDSAKAINKAIYNNKTNSLYYYFRGILCQKYYSLAIENFELALKYGTLSSEDLNKGSALLKEYKTKTQEKNNTRIIPIHIDVIRQAMGYVLYV